jgi:MFS transporter, OFA family, oxalate/formate antiporter
MKRYVILLAAVAMQLCLGATYAWSVFVKPLREFMGISQATAQLPFAVFYFAFPFTAIFSGYILKRLGPRRSAAAGGMVFGLGWALASLGVRHFAWTIAGVGLLAGVGVGLAYVVPISVLVRWFPNQRGLVTGIAVAGFGAGAALISQLAGYLLTVHAFSPFAVFGLFGLTFVVVATGAGSVMSFPDATNVDNGALLPYGEILRRREFRILYLLMIVALAAGFSVNANMKELFPSGGITTGILGVSLFAVANALGRLAWGALFDRTSSALVLRMNLIAQAIVLCSSPWLLTSTPGFLLFATAAGFNYGGVLVLYAATVTHVWGAERVGQVYGMLFSANVVAAPAPMLAGLIFDATHTFSWFFVGLSLFLVIAALVSVEADR